MGNKKILLNTAVRKDVQVKAGKEALVDLKSQPELIERLKKIFADGGYRGNLVTWVKDELNADLEIGVTHQYIGSAV